MQADAKRVCLLLKFETCVSNHIEKIYTDFIYVEHQLFIKNECKTRGNVRQKREAQRKWSSFQWNRTNNKCSIIYGQWSIFCGSILSNWFLSVVWSIFARFYRQDERFHATCVHELGDIISVLLFSVCLCWSVFLLMFIEPRIVHALMNDAINSYKRCSLRAFVEYSQGNVPSFFFMCV